MHLLIEGQDLINQMSALPHHMLAHPRQPSSLHACEQPIYTPSQDEPHEYREGSSCIGNHGKKQLEAH